MKDSEREEEIRVRDKRRAERDELINQAKGNLLAAAKLSNHPTYIYNALAALESE